MAFNRTQRINGEMQRELAEIFRTIKDPGMSDFVSVVSVNVTKDLKYAKVYISVMGDDEQKQATVAALKRATGYIKKEIAQRLNLRIVPQPTFVLDNSIDYGMHINELIKKLNGDKND